ncbi:MAG: Stp1/IreP family PP2C-type Ser/Thr phosphatase [Defluviitaleaceae bacterium]|nr:Stp1/IreP family PP2C-type Ser/Thr phosphatase [Defluviitaleaceae bacterium]
MKQRIGIGKTDIGLVRKTNEDAVFVCNDCAEIGVSYLANIYIVADGMGGHAAGEVASAMSVEAFCDFLKQAHLKDYDGEHSVERLMAAGVRTANEKLFAESNADEEKAGMGTTFTAVSISENILYFAHAGDSRCYIADSDGLRAITDDHSWVAEMQRLGRITEEEAESHPRKNMLTRALGTNDEIAVDTGIVQLACGTTVLLCSDGLTNMVSDSDILRILSSDKPLEEKVGTLINAANDGGGRDNITAVLIQT